MASHQVKIFNSAGEQIAEALHDGYETLCALCKKPDNSALEAEDALIESGHDNRTEAQAVADNTQGTPLATQ
jgi:hypothetical protein